MVSALHAVEFDGQRAVLGCAPGAASAIHGQRDVLADLLQAVLGRPVQITITESDRAPAPIVPAPATPPAPIATPANAPPSRAPAAAAQRPPSEIPPEIRDHPLVKKAESALGARLVDFVPATGE